MINKQYCPLNEFRPRATNLSYWATPETLLFKTPKIHEVCEISFKAKVSTKYVKSLVMAGKTCRSLKASPSECHSLNFFIKDWTVGLLTLLCELYEKWSDQRRQCPCLSRRSQKYKVMDCMIS